MKSPFLQVLFTLFVEFQKAVNFIRVPAGYSSTYHRVKSRLLRPRAKDKSKDHEAPLHEVSLLFQGSSHTLILGNVGVSGAILRTRRKEMTRLIRLSVPSAWSCSPHASIQKLNADTPFLVTGSPAKQHRTMGSSSTKPAQPYELSHRWVKLRTWLRGAVDDGRIVDLLFTCSIYFILPPLPKHLLAIIIRGVQIMS